MALQGTLDTFALPDVLRLLAATKKSGRLDIDGSRGRGSIDVADGAVTAVAAGAAPHATERVDALFELLRMTSGSFTFDADATVATDGGGADVEELIRGAEQVLAEWREIEAVVPSLDAHARLRRVLAGDSVTIPAESWEILARVGGGTTIRELGEALSLPEMPVSRIVRDLIELGVVELAEPEVLAAPVPVADPVVAPVDQVVESAVEQPEPVAPAPEPPAPEPADAEAVVEDTPATPSPTGADDALPVAKPIKARRRVELDDQSMVAAEDRFVPIDLPAGMSSVATSSTPIEEPDEPVDDDLAAAFPGLTRTSAEPSEDEQELARQLATLSPRAAEAVRAAADAETDEERDAALDEATEDGPINRGLLLKFLSSVKS